MPIRVVAAQAIMARCVRVSFDGPVRQLGDGAPGDALRPENYRFEAVSAPAVTVVPVAVQPAGASAVDVALDIELSPRATYRVITAGIVGADGAALSDAHNHSSFAGSCRLAGPVLGPSS
jgi:hypothetical protein